LAGLVTIGFAVFYNTTYVHSDGNGGRHGRLRFDSGPGRGWGLVPATFIGGFAVGLVSA
jgi:hypothetical protein